VKSWSLAERASTRGNGRRTLRAVLFDFDGTLWDCESLIFQAYDECFRSHGHRLSTEAWLRLMGSADAAPWRHLEELTGGSVDRAAADRLVHRRKSALLARARPRAGVRKLLTALDDAGVTRVIVSNSDRAWIARYARQCGVDDGWAFIECANGDPARAKPSPELYLSALQRLGLDAADAIAVEDSPTGVRAAKAAGLRCVAICGPLTTDHHLVDADVRITSFEQWPR
jgi:HAD superfamily hydrolase (TIGR01509 family)